jgi:plastocyanin domain-containing protein
LKLLSASTAIGAESGYKDPASHIRLCCRLCSTWLIITLAAAESIANADDTASMSTDVIAIQRVYIIAKAGRFDPAKVQLVQGLPAVLEFSRIVESNCMQKLKMPWMADAIALPMNQKVEIPVDTSMSGVFTYACGMDMVFGEVTIKPAE